MVQAVALEHVRCELCGADNKTELCRVTDDEIEFPIVQCSQCGLVYVTPRPDHASMYRFYPDDYYGEGANKFRSWIELLRRYDRRRMADTIARDLPRQGAVIDFGCGRGSILRLLAARGHACCGVERSQEAAATARTIPGASIVADIEATRLLPNESFDVALFLHSLEHLHRPKAALQEACRLLKPGGSALLTMPNIRSFQAIFGGKYWFHLEVPRHLYHFSPDTLRNMLAVCGFQVLSVEHFSFEQNPFGALQTSLNMLGFAHNNLYEQLKSGRSGKRRISIPEATCAVLLAYPALVLSTLGSLYQRGATISVRARKVS